MTIVQTAIRKYFSLEVFSEPATSSADGISSDGGAVDEPVLTLY